MRLHQARSIRALRSLLRAVDAPLPSPWHAFLMTFRLGSRNAPDNLLPAAGPHASGGASARRWGPPPPTATAGAESAAPSADAAPAAAPIRETGTVASLKPHYGFIR